METFFKLISQNGFDARDGVVNYRKALKNKTLVHVVKSERNTATVLCTRSALHASKNLYHTFAYVTWPFNIIKVSGEPMVSDGHKSGFKELRVLSETRLTYESWVIILRKFRNWVLRTFVHIEECNSNHRRILINALKILRRGNINVKNRDNIIDILERLSEISSHYWRIFSGVNTNTLTCERALKIATSVDIIYNILHDEMNDILLRINEILPDRALTNIEMKMIDEKLIQIINKYSGSRKL